MRDIKRIERVIKKIQVLWDMEPDSRFGQFMINNNLMPDVFEYWILEDDKWEEHIDKCIEARNKEIHKARKEYTKKQPVTKKRYVART